MAGILSNPSFIHLTHNSVFIPSFSVPLESTDSVGLVESHVSWWVLLSVEYKSVSDMLDSVLFITFDITFKVSEKPYYKSNCTVKPFKKRNKGLTVIF